MSSSILSLPWPLLLLIHLHILEFPHANDPEYDQNIFDASSRGLRERTKSMEDICFFLVRQIERPDQRKQILSAYPCSKPSDTIAFRTSLAKYLETLRNQVVRPLLGEAKGSTSKNQHQSVNAGAAWWWKYVFARKSLLEECVGERFVLALSTTDISEYASQAIPASDRYSEEQMTALVRMQSNAYSSLLMSCRNAKRSWVHLFSLLRQRQQDITLFRVFVSILSQSSSSSDEPWKEHIKNGQAESPKYGSISTQRLLALKDAKLQDLTRGDWGTGDGQTALRFLLEIAGIDAYREVVKTTSGDLKDTSYQASQPDEAPLPPSLPIAAAYHPSHLRSLRTEILPSSLIETSQSNESHFQNPLALHTILSAFLHGEAKTQQRLSNNLAKVYGTRDELSLQLCKFRGVEQGQSHPSLRLWRRGDLKGVNYKVQATPQMLDTLLHIPASDEASIEERVKRIRGRDLPTFPIIHDPPPFETLPDTPLRDQAAPDSGIAETLPESASFPHQRAQRLRSGRKSLRFPTVMAIKRPSLFRAEWHEENEREISRIVDAVDESMSSQEMFTPRPGTRIATSGSLTKSRTQRVSFVMPDNILSQLPELDFSDGFEGAEEFMDEGNSVTLRDVLLTADLTQYDLLQQVEEIRGDLDDSFSWD